MLMLVLAAVGCSMFYQDKGPNVVLKQKRENFKTSSILVFNFKEPSFAEGKGQVVADLFHQALLKSKKFKVVSVNNRSEWFRLGRTEEEQLQYALKEGAEQKYDYILVGSIEDYYYGGLHKTRVRLKIRLLEVATNITVFLAENRKDEGGKDTSYPMDTRLSTPSRPTDAVAEKAVTELVKKI